MGFFLVDFAISRARRVAFVDGKMIAFMAYNFIRQQTADVFLD